MTAKELRQKARDVLAKALDADNIDTHKAGVALDVLRLPRVLVAKTEPEE